MEGFDKNRLFQLLRERAFIQGEVTLASGQKSSYYFDGKMVEVCPEGAYLIGEAIYHRLKDLKVDAVGGLAVGAVPLVTSAVLSCYHHGRREIEGFWVREASKDHGTRKLVEGKLAAGARVLFVDDVITSGQSVLKAIEATRELGVRVVLVLAIIDRQAGARERFEQAGYRYEAIFTKDDFLRA